MMIAPSRRHSHFIRITLANVSLMLLNGCGRAEVAHEITPADEREVINLVLDHFYASAETHLKPANGVVLISAKVERNNFDGADAATLNGDTKCRVSDELFKSVIERNGHERAVSQFIADTPRWRVATIDEEKQMEPFSEQTDRVRNVKTLASLLAPGFSKNGNQAAVFLSFTNSAHGASARYVLARENGRWVVSCTELLFFV